MKHVFMFILVFVLVRPPLPAANEPYAGSVVMPYTGTGAYVICVDEANVYGGPSSELEVQYTLPRGTEVNVRERARWTMEGWAMIKPAYWVSADDICEAR